MKLDKFLNTHRKTIEKWFLPFSAFADGQDAKNFAKLDGLFVIKDRRIEDDTCFYDRDGVCREVVERRGKKQ